jgi:HTH-type transcriptional regulator/antitoxin HigA
VSRVIVTEEQHERMLAEIEKLMDKGEDRTAEEDAALDLTVRLIKDYEEKNHPLLDPSPHEMLVYLMEQRSLKQADLLPYPTPSTVNALSVELMPNSLPSFSRSRRTYSFNYSAKPGY